MYIASVGASPQTGKIYTLDAFDRYKFVISKIQNGNGRHLEKSNNRRISAAVRAILTKFGTMTQFKALDRSDR